jgi:N-acetylglutamate synthase-like GNAT family acetyltransferase
MENSMNFGRGEYNLIQVEKAKDWEAYHSIRRTELFEAKGRVGIYDPNRPEEQLPENLPLLLKYSGRAIGTTRLDLRSDGTAVIRLVAIFKNGQGKGHGRELARQVEMVARHHGVTKMLVNAAPEAVGYYQKLGYVREDWDPSELQGISSTSIQMSKSL